MLQPHKKIRLVGDIGGSNIRLALASIHLDSIHLPTIKLDHIWTAQTASFTDLQACVDYFLEGIPSCAIDDAVFAVAAPTDGIRAHLTNANWTADVSQLQIFGETLQNIPACLINDLQAAGQGVLLSQHHQILQNGNRKNGMTVVMGVGTGLGMVLCADEFYSTEFGHASFAPFSPQTHELCDFLSKMFLSDPSNINRVRNEDVLSGRGFELLRAFFQQRTEEMIPCDIPFGQWLINHPSHDITQRALEMIASIFGSIIGDVILATLPKQVVLCGGIVEKMPNIFQHESFWRALKSKQPMESLILNTTVSISLESHLGLMGAAGWSIQV